MYNNNRSPKQLIILSLIVALIGGCSSTASQPIATTAPMVVRPTVTSGPPTASPTSNEPSMTRIVIDGNDDDWVSYNVIGTDPAGEQTAGSPDLAEVKAFNNNLYFYLLIRLHENGVADHYDILMDTNGGQFDYQVSVWPESNQARFAVFPVSNGMNPLDGVTSAQEGKVIEVKIPLSAIKNQPVRAFLVQTFTGSVVGDKMNNLTPELVSDVEPTPVAVITQSTPQPTQSPEAGGPLSHVVFLDPNYTAKTVYLSEIPPYVVRAGLNDEVLVLNTHDDTIYQVGEDGTLSVYAAFPNFSIEEFAFDHAGNLWFSINDNKLYEVKDGSPVQIAQNVNRRFAFDSQDNVYAVDFPSHGVQKITPNGQVTFLAGDLEFYWIDISPKDEIVAMSIGRLIQLQPDGQWQIVKDGFGGEASSNFAPDGKVYITDFSGIDVVDLQSGAKQHLSWYDQYSNTGANAIFDHSGRLLIWHANTSVTRLDFKARTAKVIYLARGNTTAMALGPDGNLYVAYGDRLANGNTTLYRIIDQTHLEKIFQVPYGFALSLAFAPDGVGFLGVGDREVNGMIYQFDPVSGEFKTLLSPKCWPSSMAVNPDTGNLWWFSCESIQDRSSTGKVQDHPIPKGTTNKFLAFAPDSTLYAMIWFGYNTADKSVTHGIYRRDVDGSWVQLTDMTHPDPGITISMIAVCPDGNLYAIQHLHGNEVGLDYLGINNTVFVIDRATGERTPLAWGISPDAGAVVCSPENHLFFTTIDGIVEFYRK